jgi:CubicO group peptidase (beta-lactamase class C family)
MCNIPLRAWRDPLETPESPEPSAEQDVLLRGGLVSTAEEYAQFALMLCAGGQWNGKRLLGPKTVELMSSVFVPDTLPGRAPGRGYGLSVDVVSDPVAAGRRISKGSFGWDGAYGTHSWVDPQEKLIAVMMIQTDNPDRHGFDEVGFDFLVRHPGTSLRQSPLEGNPKLRRRFAAPAPGTWLMLRQSDT